MKRILNNCLISFLMIVILVCIGSAAADVVVHVDGELKQVTERGGQIICKTTDYLEAGQTIDLVSYYDHAETYSVVTGYTVGVNGQLYNYYNQKDLDCHIPYEVWHQNMVNDKDVEVIAIINTSKGKAVYNFLLELKENDAKPACDVHQFRFQIDKDHQDEVRCSPCSAERNKHFLSACYGYNECVVCGEKTETAYYTFSEENSPAKAEHKYADEFHNGRICIMTGCGYEKPSPVFTLTLENDGKWEPGHEYTAELTWDPEDLNGFEITWGTHYYRIFTLDKEADMSQWNVAEVISADGNRCKFRANENGQVFISVVEGETNTEIWECAEVRNDYIDEAKYYRLLNQLNPEEDPLENEDIRRMIRDELLRITAGDTDRADSILSYISQAEQPYKNLYCWSFFDYVKEGNPLTDGSYHVAGRLQFTGVDPTVLFHETGHAIAYALNKEDISISDKYRDEFYNALYYTVYKNVSEAVMNAARGSELTTEEKFAVIEYIMGDSYRFYIQMSSKDALFFPGAVWSIDQQMTDQYSDKQKEVFDTALSTLHDYLHLFEVDENSGQSGDNANMIFDIYAGCTNQVALGDKEKLGDIIAGRGHGPVANVYANPENYPKDYWFRDGLPSYKQNQEGWAEFFSSQMSGAYRTANREEFPEACEVMDRMAEELLEGYRNKHSPTQ